MTKHVKGSAVTNATSYKLYKLVSEEYTELATQNTGGAIDFDLSELTLADGTYTLAVKAFDSTGTYADSDYSNTVSYTVAEDPVTPTNYTFTINPDPTSATVTLSATGYSTVTGTGSKSITVANGTVVSWSVSANGYTEQSGTETVTKTDSKSVVLSEIESTASYVNHFNPDDPDVNLTQYMTDNDTWATLANYGESGYIVCSANDVIRAGRMDSGTWKPNSTMSTLYYDANKQYVRKTLQSSVLGDGSDTSDKGYVVPNDSTIAYFRTVIRTDFLRTGVIITINESSKPTEYVPYKA